MTDTDNTTGQTQTEESGADGEESQKTEDLAVEGEGVDSKGDAEKHEQNDSKPDPDGKTDDDDDEAPEDSLEAVIGKPTPVSLDRKPKHRELEEGDIDVDTDGTKLVRSKELHNDLVEIFGDDNTKMDLSRFLVVDNHKPKKATAIAELAGYKGRGARSRFRSDVEDLQEAIERGDLQRVEDVKSKMPKWIYDLDEQIPFKIDVTNKGTDVATSAKKATSSSYDKKELDNAINLYCVEKGEDKKSLMRIPGLGRALDEFSKMERNGNRLTAFEALSYAIKQSKVDTTLPKEKQVSLGGANNVSSPPKKDDGFNQKEFDEYNKSLEEIGCSSLSKDAFINAKKNGIV